MPAGNDIQLAIVIHIDCGARAVGCMRVDVVPSESRVLGGVYRLASPSGRCQNREEKRSQSRPLHTDSPGLPVVVEFSLSFRRLDGMDET